MRMYDSAGGAFEFRLRIAKRKTPSLSTKSLTLYISEAISDPGDVDHLLIWLPKTLQTQLFSLHHRNCRTGKEWGCGCNLICLGVHLSIVY